jgi:hypothetical protein
MSSLLLSAVMWAFSFWLVADCLRRRASPFWLVVILLVQPYGGVAYLLYLKWSRYRGRPIGAAAPVAAATAGPGGPGQIEEPALEVADRLEEQRRFAEAAQIYRRALEQDPRDPRALHGLARCSVELEQPREALEAFEALMAVDPRYRNYSAALEYAEALHRAGRDPDATGLLEGMVEETGRLNHRLALAHYCEAAGQTARAKSVLSDALAAYASSPLLEQEANRHWHRRITDKLDELAAG